GIARQGGEHAGEDDHHGSGRPRYLRPGTAEQGREETDEDGAPQARYRSRAGGLAEGQGEGQGDDAGGDATEQVAAHMGEIEHASAAALSPADGHTLPRCVWKMKRREALMRRSRP